MGLDAIVRGGTVVDGTGAPPRAADVGIKDGKIAAVGDLPANGAAEIDATGKLVTPGFVDIHTHYDGQATWDSRLQPSSWHGVTTVVMGNCGVGFAPVHERDHDRLIRLMEGVEDIPFPVLTEGLPWTWKSYPDYLDAVSKRAFDVDVASQLPHAALRVFVMGERGVNREPATAEDIDRMAGLAREAMEAGAIGFGTSRTLNHRASDGSPIAKCTCTSASPGRPSSCQITRRRRDSSERAAGARMAASSSGAIVSAAASKKQYPPAAPLGGLPMAIHPVTVSARCQAQVPSEVPTISR